MPTLVRYATFSSTRPPTWKYQKAITLHILQLATPHKSPLVARALLLTIIVCQWVSLTPDVVVPGELGGYPKSGGRKNAHMGISWRPKKVIWVYLGRDAGGVFLTCLGPKEWQNQRYIGKPYP